MSGEDLAEAPTGGFNLRDVAAILLRWRILLAASLALGTVGGLAAGLLMKPVYRASASLLIESQDLPVTVVASPLNDMAEERIGKIREQILSRNNLTKLIARNRLYPRERQRMSADVVRAMLRNAIHFDLVSAAANNNSGRGSGSTIAFTLSYTNRDPSAALAVTEQLTDMFVLEDNRLRSEQMQGAASFLVHRADELRDRLVELEAKRRSIEARYNGALPDQVATTAQSTASLRAEMSRVDTEMQGVMQQNGMLTAKSEEVGPPPPTPAQLELARAQAQLDKLTITYSDTHPDVVAARAMVRIAKAAVAKDPPPRDPTAPIHAEVAAGRQRIAMLAQRHAELAVALSRVEQQVAAAPQASYELNNVERESDNLKQQYQAIRDKQLDAQVAANLQAEGKGERFSVVDRPTFPNAPSSPQRTRLVLMGAVGGLILGLAFVLAWEVLVKPVEGAGAIVKLTGAEPLAAIPSLKTGPLSELESGLARFLSRRRRHFFT
jgi:uncharacterized protein involved in exopolysaccharide biosynthesis